MSRLRRADERSKEKQNAGEQSMTTKMTPGNLSELWEEHTKDEFVTRDTEATLATMVDEGIRKITFPS
jgi:hypothetical protein